MKDLDMELLRLLNARLKTVEEVLLSKGIVTMEELNDVFMKNFREHLDKEKGHDKKEEHKEYEQNDRNT